MPGKTKMTPEGAERLQAVKQMKTGKKAASTRLSNYWPFPPAGQSN